MKTVHEEAEQVLSELGIADGALRRGDWEAHSPITGETLAHVQQTSTVEAQAAIAAAYESFLLWRHIPPPVRGDLLRIFAEELRSAKPALGRLITLEAGKIASEGLGEVQEMIDICVFAAGLSRQLYGLTIASERQMHRMMETWHPLGVIGIISAFNFPVAVWSWNAALALVCGNTCVWKPSEKTLLSALGVQAVFQRAMTRFEESTGGPAPPHLSSLLLGGPALGEVLVDDARVALISATGSSRMGREVGPRAARRFARTILELGGNNAAIVCPSADLHLALQGIAFSAIGTAGQRCTTLRRLFVHEQIYERLVGQLQAVYESVQVGDPRADGILVGPLIDGAAFTSMQASLDEARADGGTVFGGERVIVGGDDSFYCRPALVEMPRQTAVVRRETFAPILYLLRFRDFEEAIRLHNDVPQGLASSIFTNDVREAERFLSDSGSDCGLVNVNLGTSGAEIGGAFGGEKETGGGRESGSDAWKSYMRRATNVINYGQDLPLAQGVTFPV